MRNRLHVPTTAGLLFALAIATGCASTQSVGEQIDDSVIVTKINSKLAADSEVNPFNVDVDALDGVVTLRGEVEKATAKQRAEELALETAGVVTVHNEILVVPAALEDDDTGSDVWITTKIKAKLVADPQLNPFNIDVDTLDGRVTLSGKVRSAEARAEAEKLALDTKGVVEVDNRLEVVG